MTYVGIQLKLNYLIEAQNMTLSERMKNETPQQVQPCRFPVGFGSVPCLEPEITYCYGKWQFHNQTATSVPDRTQMVAGQLGTVGNTTQTAIRSAAKPKAKSSPKPKLLSAPPLDYNLVPPTTLIDQCTLDVCIGSTTPTTPRSTWLDRRSDVAVKGRTTINRCTAALAVLSMIPTPSHLAVPARYAISERMFYMISPQSHLHISTATDLSTIQPAHQLNLLWKELQLKMNTKMPEKMT